MAKDKIGDYTLQELLGSKPVSPEPEKKTNPVVKLIATPFRLAIGLVKAPFRLAMAIVKSPFRVLGRIFGGRKD